MIENRFIVVIAFVVMSISNIISTTSNLYNHTNNTKISKENPTALTPDGITFAIWGPIYLFELGTVVFQCWKKGSLIKESTREWLAGAFTLNAVWLPLFAYEYWWLSLLVITAYAWTLVELYSWDLHIDYGNDKHWKDKLWGYTGVSLNLAWVTVATLLNITIVFRNSRIVYTHSGTSIVGGNPDWAIACIVAASAIALYKLVHSADIPYGLATAWALFGIYRNQEEEQHQWALVFAITLLASTFVRLVLCVRSTRVKKTPLQNNLLGHT